LFAEPTSLNQYRDRHLRSQRLRVRDFPRRFETFSSSLAALKRRLYINANNFDVDDFALCSSFTA
jgi:hypothetical protein